ncbi:MAG: ankyrin repeat domain-containing protein [Wolbachia sp.]
MESNKNTESNKNIGYLLNFAAIGDIEGVKFFIKHCNVDVNSIDNIGRTALHKAAYKGKSSIVEYLLLKEANVSS